MCIMKIIIDGLWKVSNNAYIVEGKQCRIQKLIV